MKVIRNEKYVQRRGKIGRYASLAALIVLLIGMLISFFRPEFIIVSFVCLLVGLVLSQVGIYYGNRFTRIDRPDEVLSRSLKGLDDRYALYHYKTPTPHVLVGPDACYVLSVQMQGGKVSAQGSRWKQSLGWKWLFAWMGQESIGNPAKSAQIEVESLEHFLDKQLPGVDVPVRPVVVFSHPDVELNVADTVVPVVHAKQLKDWVRTESKGEKLAAGVRADLAKLLGNGD